MSTLFKVQALAAWEAIPEAWQRREDAYAALVLAHTTFNAALESDTMPDNTDTLGTQRSDALAELNAADAAMREAERIHEKTMAEGPQIVRAEIEAEQAARRGRTQ